MNNTELTKNKQTINVRTGTDPFIEAIVSFDGNNECSIIMKDGGHAHIWHNDEHILTQYYQSRIERYHGEDWSVEIAEGKAYIKDWEGSQQVNHEMILDAMDWLTGNDNSGRYLVVPTMEWNDIKQFVKFTE